MSDDVTPLFRGDWLYGDEGVDRPEIEVCTTHRRFLPCRRDGGHTFSSRRDDIEAVREYQQGKIRDYNEERR